TGSMQQHQPEASAKLAGPIGMFAFAVCFALTSCGGAQSATPSAQTAHFPVTIALPDGRTVNITKQPHRIVSLSSTATEMLFAIGAGSQVIAVDDQSDYPSNVPKPNLRVSCAFITNSTTRTTRRPRPRSSGRCTSC